MAAIRDIKKYDRILERDNFRCTYCGFDGRSFDNWMQLTIDHIIPQAQEVNDNDDNLTTACHSCNSLTSKLPENVTKKSKDEIIKLKRTIVLKSRGELLKRWYESVTVNHLNHLDHLNSHDQ